MFYSSSRSFRERLKPFARMQKAMDESPLASQQQQLQGDGEQATFPEKRKRGRPPGSKNKNRYGQFVPMHGSAASGSGIAEAAARSTSPTRCIPGQSIENSNHLAVSSVGPASGEEVPLRRGPGRPTLPGRSKPGIPIVAEVRLLEKVRCPSVFFS